ncbi:hypothetical protein HBI30_063960 [Parastagonospora nodorum]|nr:hypothetical protein HBH52_025250 [Parastagonospora nodorum]KAH5069799.1 hypothetical protein HBH95_185550 [Parastagonospora nodorum]KAH5457591.1 hypothetical protein HBI30_063960 [Parastagonospora nodorum]KAH5713720.1 hypothetical protein HBI20_157200 [Parastagonospora nodorum]
MQLTHILSTVLLSLSMAAAAPAPQESYLILSGPVVLPDIPLAARQKCLHQTPQPCSSNEQCANGGCTTSGVCYYNC